MSDDLKKILPKQTTEAENEPEVPEVPGPEAEVSAPKLPQEEIERLINDNIKLAYWFASKYTNIPGVKPEDVSSQAVHGLVKAANTYDPAKGNFAAYASRIMRNYLNHLHHKQGEKVTNEPGSMDAPLGGEDGGEDTSMHDKVGDTGLKSADTDLGQSEASQILADEIENIPEPTRSMVKRWMNGESYRDMQADFGITFMQIRNKVTAAMADIKASLASKGIINLQDIWPESLEQDDDGVHGNFIYECMLTHITSQLSIKGLQEKSIREQLANS